MAKASCNFEKASAHSDAHNSRKEKPDYLLPEKFHLGNEYWNNQKTAKELFDLELQKSERKGGRVPKFENSHWEAVLNLNKIHTLQDCQKVAQYIEQEFNIICTQISIHRDEGHINEKGVVEYNLHAHLNFMTFKDNRQNWRLEKTREKMPFLQTEVAKILNMERGKESNYTLEQKRAIKEKVGKLSSYPDKKTYNKKFTEVAKELGFENRGTARKHLKPKAFKEQKEAEEFLKAEIKNLRAELQEQKATRADYAKLEQFNKDLKEQLEKKEMTIAEMQTQINKHKTLSNELQAQNKQKDEQIIALQEKIDSTPSVMDLTKTLNEIAEPVLSECGIKSGIYKSTDVVSFLKKKYFELSNKIKELLSELTKAKEEISLLTASKVQPPEEEMTELEKMRNKFIKEKEEMDTSVSRFKMGF